MIRTRECDVCGRPYEFRHPSSRFCSSRCRQRHHRAPAKVLPLARPSSELVDTVTRTLADAGQRGSVLGAVALALAEAMGTPGQSGAAVASLSKELRTVMETIAANRTAPDLIDELRRRREARLARS